VGDHHSWEVDPAVLEGTNRVVRTVLVIPMGRVDPEARVVLTIPHPMILRTKTNASDHSYRTD
jgi:hypothetical protein